MGETLSVLSWAGGWGRALTEAVSQPFGREYGVAVQQVPHIGLRLPEALLATLRAGDRPPVDVVWCNAGAALLAQQAGLCDPLDPDELPVLDTLRARARPEGDAGFPFVCPYVVYYVLVYVESACPAGPPRSWNELLAPVHRRRVALYPEGHGFFPLAQILGGGALDGLPDAMEPCWSYLRRLAPQVGELGYSIGMEERLRTGQLSLCFRALTNALAFAEAGLPVSFVIPEEGTTDTVDAFFIPRGLPAAARRRAQQYVGYALRRDVQAHLCQRLGAMPVHPEATVPALLRRHAKLPADADDNRGILHISESLKAAHAATWAAGFAAAMQGTGTR